MVNGWLLHILTKRPYGTHRSTQYCGARLHLSSRRSQEHRSVCEDHGFFEARGKDGVARGKPPRVQSHRRVANTGGQNVDAVLCSMQTGTQESQSSPSCSLRVRLGMITTVAIRITIANIPIQHASSPPAMRDTDLTRQDRPTHPRAGAARMVRHVLVQTVYC